MRSAFALAAVLAAAVVSAGEHPHASPKPSKPVTLVPGLGDHHRHPIATKSVEAQKFFDQGLRFVYAFNHDEAVRSFQRAAELDPASPMPMWGIALALGPNINLDVDPQREKAAYEAVQKASALAKDAPGNERAYVAALAHRYSDDPKADLRKLAEEYRDAMRELVASHPDDLDAATLYAESIMDLRPWQLWTLDGKPAEGTEELLAVLESVLRRDPMHPGANHYYIHAIEASPHPERALASAARLERLAPTAGHLVHMPSHIYARTGDFERAAQANEAAVAVDRDYIRRTGVQGVYPITYYSHNLFFLATVYATEGRFTDAKKAADALVANVTPALDEMPMGSFFLPAPNFVCMRFARWDDVLRSPAVDARFAMANALWHFARGAAFAAKHDLESAARERQAFAEALKRVPAGEMFGYNEAATVAGVAAAELDARIAAARGDREGSIAAWRKAVDAQDELSYDEPPDWYHPTRESLGAALLLDGQAAEAERVFRRDLEQNPRNPRSLFGLRASLVAQARTSDADWVEREFEQAWKNAQVRLRLEDL